METVTISKKEYNALVFAKAPTTKKSKNKFSFLGGGFGVLKRSFGNASSVAVVNNIRELKIG